MSSLVRSEIGLVSGQQAGSKYWGFAGWEFQARGTLPLVSVLVKGEALEITSKGRPGSIAGNVLGSLWGCIPHLPHVFASVNALRV